MTWFGLDSDQAGKTVAKVLQTAMAADQQKQSVLKTEHALAMSIIVLAGFLGMAAWLSQGDSLLWSVIQSGLAWCF